MLDTSVISTPAAAPASGGFKFKPVYIAAILAFIAILGIGIWIYRLRKRNAALYKAARELSEDMNQVTAELEHLRDELTEERQRKEFDRALDEKTYNDRFIQFPFRPTFDPNPLYVVAYDEEFAHWAVRPLFELEKNYDSCIYVFYSQEKEEWTLNYRANEHPSVKVPISIKAPHTIFSNAINQAVQKAVQKFGTEPDIVFVTQPQKQELAPETDTKNEESE